MHVLQRITLLRGRDVVLYTSLRLRLPRWRRETVTFVGRTPTSSHPAIPAWRQRRVGQTLARGTPRGAVLPRGPHTHEYVFKDRVGGGARAEGRNLVLASPSARVTCTKAPRVLVRAFNAGRGAARESTTTSDCTPPTVRRYSVFRTRFLDL